MFSHNLRSPIAGLKMLFPLYEMEGDEKGRKDIFENIKLGSSEMFDMIEDLSKILLDYWELENPREEISLQEILDGTLGKLRSEIPEDCQIIGNFDSCPTLYFSKKYIDFAFNELILNSIRFRSDTRGLKISISSYKVGEKSILSFEDNGSGIDIDLHKIDLYKMYKTFHNDDTIPNRGLGIFSLKNQIEMMGGKIKIDGKKDIGFKVTIEILP